MIDPFFRVIICDEAFLCFYTIIGKNWQTFGVETIVKKRGVSIVNALLLHDVYV